ncbi:MAG: ABC transporter permease subunit, partial [Candidatus Tectomicrobia bacterium]|nr:ABC transporter permease subunit [Candidatus Tectomicrobia bacterium]
MKNCYAIMKRELRSYFSSSIAYTVVTIFLLISGWFFYNSLAFYTLLSFQMMQNQFTGAELNLTEGVIRPLFGNISVIMLLMMPLLTMRLFAEEKKLGTFELLFTYPIRDIETLFGKFLACVGVFLVMLLLTSFYPILLA